MNSSPPTRPRSGPGPPPLASTSPVRRSMASPAAWPCSSLMILRPLRSMATMLSGQGPAPDAVEPSNIERPVAQLREHASCLPRYSR